MRPKGTVLVFVIITIVLIGLGLFIFSKIFSNTPLSYSSPNGQSSSSPKLKIASPDELTYQYSSNLDDLTRTGAKGRVSTGFFDGSFTLYAKIYSLKDPNPKYVYQGWVGKKDDGGEIKYTSVGLVAKNGDDYVNIFQGGTDWTNRIYYVISEENELAIPISPSNKLIQGILQRNEIQPTPKTVR